MKRISSLPTLKDVAKEAGVAVMTVSRVINGGSYIGASTEKRVRTAIKALGYTPNEAARMLKGQCARMLGHIVPDLSDPFFATCANAIQAVARTYGYMTLIVATGRSKVSEDDEIKMMAARNVAGLIIVPSRYNHASLKSMHASGIPIVALDRPIQGISTDEVAVENISGAEEAVCHLISHGHSRIACLGFDADVDSISQRVQGYANAMQAAGLRPEIWNKVPSLASVGAVVERWCRSSKRPTAVFTLNSVTTANLLQVLHQQNLKVPEDVAIIGFDDFEYAPLLASPLTTIRQPLVELGCQAAKLLFARIRKEVQPDTSGIRVVLPVELIVRESCGCNETRLIKSDLAQSRSDRIQTI